MTEKLKGMIDKLKKQQVEKQAKEQQAQQPQAPPPQAPPQAEAPLQAPQTGVPEPQAPPQPEAPQPEAKKELSQEQKIAVANRIQELQNNGVYRLESLIAIEELTTAVNNLTVVISSLIKQ